MNILSFGGGVQTTALAILAARKEVQVDAVVFADTGAEKPETYWYMKAYTEPLFKEAGIPLQTIRSQLKSRQPDLYGWLWRTMDIPRVWGKRQCSWNFKRQPIHAAYPYSTKLIGFSAEERNRAKSDSYPLIEMGITGSDCLSIITDYGWPIPIKSSCFFCPFQRPTDWQWLKRRHPDMFDKALALEENFYMRFPLHRDTEGLYGGKPLWHWATGKQEVLFELVENSCWSGACGH